MSGLTVLSLFDGVGGFPLALQRAGAEVVATVEIDPPAAAVSGKHFPNATQFRDVTKVSGDDIRAAGFVPDRGVATAGWPCQDFSVAGRRAGLAGARSGLWWEVVRVLAELRPRWFIGENVPGLLSSVCQCPGDDTCVINNRADECGDWCPVKPSTDVSSGRFRRAGRQRYVWVAHIPHTPRGGACAGGCMHAHGGAMGSVLGSLGELGYGVAYRVLDAKYFGVPQQRRRVFIVGHLGAPWGAPTEVLLEPQGSSRDSAAGNHAGQGATGVAAGSVGAAGCDVATAAPGRGTSETPHRREWVAALRTSGPGGNGGPDDNAAQAGHIVVQPLAIRGRDGGAQLEVGAAGAPYNALRAGDGGSSRQSLVAITGQHTHALTAEGADASEDGTGRGTPIISYAPDKAATLTSGRSATEGVNPPGRRQEDDTNIIAFDWQTQGSERSRPPVSTTHTSALSTTRQDAISDETIVRRLTPLECERLQGFPDQWTEGQSDAQRYREMGNSLAVPVVEWIAFGLVAVDERINASEVVA